MRILPETYSKIITRDTKIYSHTENLKYYNQGKKTPTIYNKEKAKQPKYIKKLKNDRFLPLNGYVVSKMLIIYH